MSETLAALSLNPSLFWLGLIIIYISGFILLLAVIWKFIEYSELPVAVKKQKKHLFSTKEMLVCVLILFPFWINSIGQIPMTFMTQGISFGIGYFGIVFATLWHLKAKWDIRRMWSDAIEIKHKHTLMTSGAFTLARHPMYASLLLWCWSASFMMFNYVTLSLTTFILLPLMFIRAKAEEKELLQVYPDYLLYQQNVRMLTPTLSGIEAIIIKCTLIGFFAYYLVSGIDIGAMLLLFCLHLYLGYCLLPEKVAFSYRSKSGMMLVFWGLSLIWYPFYFVLYFLLGMFIYGLKFNCPCMIVYNKYHRCPCFDLVANCIYSKKIKKK